MRTPRLGALFAVDASGRRTRIESPYNPFDVGAPVLHQFISRVVRVSSASPLCLTRAPLLRLTAMPLPAWWQVRVSSFWGSNVSIGGARCTTLPYTLPHLNLALPYLTL